MKFSSFFLTLSLSVLTVNSQAADTHIIRNGQPADIVIDKNDFAGVRIAAESLSEDFERVSGTKAVITGKAAGNKVSVIVGTLGKSKLIDRYITSSLKKELSGKTEKFIITDISTGGKDGSGMLLIAGSDMRGTIYGIYELSEMMGVSPWYWWADVPTKKQQNITIKAGTYTDGEPAVRYRGLFLNDEAPCLTSWVKNTYGTNYGDHYFYARVFELILRLKGNYLWPAMWGWSFYADDPLNSKTANEMGIIMGTSHHEPMARNHQEYARNRKAWGDWDYVKNKSGLDRFFTEGIERAKDTEDLITIGMRGDGDTAMGGKEGHDDENISDDERVMNILKDVIDNQRAIIEKVTGAPACERPQVWALYKEVQKYYDLGLRVPEDVTILLSDDNWGDVRSLPTKEEVEERKGGWGMYYHVDYVGAPRNSKWLNITPLQNMWEQLQLTYSYGVDKLWVLNVGDLKPMELPISFWFEYAWNPEKMNRELEQMRPDGLVNEVDLTKYLVRFCRQQFGDEEAWEAARIINLYTKYNGRVTPEMLDAQTFNFETGEWKMVRDDYDRLGKDAQRQYDRISQEYRDAYYQLVLYPVKAMANLYDMYFSAAKGDEEQMMKDFNEDKNLQHYYNKVMAGGKWDGMMTQKHIGYTTWNDNFPEDTPPRVMKRSDADGKVWEQKDVIVIEAEHFDRIESGKNTKWTVVKDMGRTLSAVALMPYTEDTQGASISYDVMLPTDLEEVDVYVTVKSTLAFKNKEGHRFSVQLDNGKPVVVNFNKDINENHPYDKLYPTVARRVIENKVRLTAGEKKGTKSLEKRTLTLSPLDPGVVFEKIIIDLGGYQKTYLGMNETRKM